MKSKQKQVKQLRQWLTAAVANAGGNLCDFKDAEEGSTFNHGVRRDDRIESNYYDILNSRYVKTDVLASFEVEFNKVTLQLLVLEHEGSIVMFSPHYLAMIGGSGKLTGNSITEYVTGMKTGCENSMTPAIFKRHASELFTNTLIPLLCIG